MKRIELSRCSIPAGDHTTCAALSLSLQEGETWLFTGKQGSFTSYLAGGLCKKEAITVLPGGLYSNPFHDSAALVSFDTVHEFLENQKKFDDSDFVEGGIDTGKTPRMLFSELSCEPGFLESLIQLTGLQPILDRGLKFLSTGEARRTVLCTDLAKKPDLLVLDDPFDGLDVLSRERLSKFLEQRRIPLVILVMEEVHEIPSCVTHILETRDHAVSFTGTKAEYQNHTQRNTEQLSSASSSEPGLREVLSAQIFEDIHAPVDGDRELVSMRNVQVEWSGVRVLEGLNWTIRKGEHWLIRGPNGSGKTTLLELITGDNPQVFRNDIEIFGTKRGSGETIWDIKRHIGFVSWKLHMNYRSQGDLTLEAVLVSGLHDSIGLYQACGEREFNLARTWLGAFGFNTREKERFKNLSYGEQRAVLILRAAIKLPPLLILDEPCHALDHDHRTLVLSLLQGIAEIGRSTLLHVTHDPEEVLPCERHILELRPGEKPAFRVSHL